MSRWRESVRAQVYRASGSALDRLRGRNAPRLLAELESMQSWERDRLEAWRRAELASLLEHAYDHVAFYRRRFEQAGLTRADLRRPGVLGAIPILAKDELRASWGELIADNASGRLRFAVTSGSSGEPVRIARDAASEAWMYGLFRRAMRWHGVEPYDPRVMLLGAPQRGRSRLRSRVVDVVTGRRLHEFHDVSSKALVAAAYEIRRFRPRLVSGYPSVLHDLAWACRDAGLTLRDVGVRVVHTQSEMLLDAHRESIEQLFGPAQLLNEYGGVEVGAMAYGCDAGRMHVSHEHVWLETVDDAGEPTAPGAAGRILLTPLRARAMPLIRYDVGDVGALSGEACTCGRHPGMPVLARLEGRTFERIRGRQGGLFSGGIVHYMLKRAGLVGSLRGYLAVQRRVGEIDLMLQPSADIAPEQYRELAGVADEIFGGEVRVAPRVVDALPPRTGRKRAYFISELGET